MDEKPNSDGVTVPDPNWFLEGFAGDKRVMRRVHVEAEPFQVGRGASMPLALNFSNISRLHAEIYFFNSTLMVRDLGSRNGTFVNYQRISAPTPLKSGDIVHFGTCEFRVGYEEPVIPEELGDTVSFEGNLPRQLQRGTAELVQLLKTESVFPLFQPILTVPNRGLVGYEVLGRGGMIGFFSMPLDLFRVAATLGLEDELSRAFRTKGTEVGATIPGDPLLFLNIHPVEMRELPTLTSTLEVIRKRFPKLRLALEIHEALVTDPEAMRNLRSALRDHGIQLAYDDFGAGQARLMELVEVPPDYLKFDISLIHRIEKAPPQRQQMVEMLVRFAADMGVKTLAEGVETGEEAAFCEKIGFHCVQGFYYGKPLRVEDLLADETSCPATGGE